MQAWYAHGPQKSPSVGAEKARIWTTKGSQKQFEIFQLSQRHMSFSSHSLEELGFHPGRARNKLKSSRLSKCPESGVGLRVAPKSSSHDTSPSLMNARLSLASTWVWLLRCLSLSSRQEELGGRVWGRRTRKL